LKSSELIHRPKGEVVKRSEDPGDRVTKYFLGEKVNLHKVTKGRVNLDLWIWNGHMAEIHGIKRRIPLDERGVG
jgi:hypothetical protein